MEKEELTLNIHGETGEITSNVPDSDAQSAVAESASQETAPDQPVKTSDTMEINSLKDTDFTGELDNEEYEELPPTEEEIAAKRAAARRAKIRKRKKAMQRHERTFAHIFGGILLTVFIVSVSVMLAVYIIGAALDFTGITTNDYDIQVEIPENTDATELAKILADSGVIQNEDLFRFYATNLAKTKDDYLSGMYTLKTSMSYSTIVSTLQTLVTVNETIMLQIPEGLTGVEIGQLLEENCVCKAEDFEYYYKNKMNKYDFEKRVEQSNLKFNQMEGYLFPDTYEFYVVEGLKKYKASLTDDEEGVYDITNLDTSDNAKSAAEKMFSNFNSKMSKEYYKRMGELNLTLDETIALASMVQEEASKVNDMKDVASVFLNRLIYSETYPHLDSDVTVIYVNEYIKPFTNTSNTSLYQKIFDAYNTYERVGVPVGAICNPGLNAIEAVLYANKTNYFYFCANVETGMVYFANTHAQHEANLVLAGLTGNASE